MSTNHEHDGEDELQAARRTAHALGQTEGAEHAEVAAELAASPQARQEVEAVEALAAQLKEVAREAPRPEPSPALREAVERRLAELEPAAGRAAAQGPARPWWQSRLAALALTVACLLVFTVPIARWTHLLGPGKEREVAKQSANQPTTTQDNLISELDRPLEEPDVSDIGDIEAKPAPEMDLDPTLEKPGVAAQGHPDDAPVAPLIEHKGGGTARGPIDRDGAMAFGPSRPRVAGPQGVGTGVGTGRDSGGDGSDVAPGFARVVMAVNRRTCLKVAPATALRASTSTTAVFWVTSTGNHPATSRTKAQQPTSKKAKLSPRQRVKKAVKARAIPRSPAVAKDRQTPSRMARALEGSIKTL